MSWKERAAELWHKIWGNKPDKSTALLPGEVDPGKKGKEKVY